MDVSFLQFIAKIQLL